MMNTNRIVTGAAAVVAAAGLAFGATSLASADENTTSTPSPSSTSQSQGDGAPQRQGAPNGNTDPSKPMRSDEQLLTGDTLAKVTAAAKAKEPNATIERVETDSEGVYEAHMVRADGTHITVQVDESFAVTNVQEGGPNGSGAPGDRGDHDGAKGDSTQPTPSSTSSTDSTEAN
jgi:hypothetical protein